MCPPYWGILNHPNLMEKVFNFQRTALALLSLLVLPFINMAEAAGPGKIIKAALLDNINLGTCSDESQVAVPVALTDSIIHQLVRQTARGGYEIKTVVIDPGHGGHDPGCHGDHSKEKHICLAIGKYLSKALEDNYPDIKVIMTRSTDVFIPLHERAAIATRNKADLFISIHCNFIPKADHIHGTETYVLGLHATEANLQVAKRENESILFEDNYQETYGYDPNSAEAHIMFSMFQNAYLEQSILFAEKVQKSANLEAKRKNRGVKQAGFLVLRHATMPSVLVETGYLSNKNEEDYLRTQSGQKAMANALLEAFAAYKSDIENKPAPLAGNLKKLDTSNTEPQGRDEPAPTVAPAPDEPVVVAVKTELPQKIQPEQDAVQNEAAPVTKNRSEPLDRQPAKRTNEPPAAPKTKPSNDQSGGNGKIIPTSPVAESAPTTVNISSQYADIQYRVQLAASPKLLDTTAKKWSQTEYLVEVVEEGGLYKYQVRNFATLEEASKARLKLRAIGFNDAFVAIYQDGKRVK